LNGLEGRRRGAERGDLADFPRERKRERERARASVNGDDGFAIDGQANVCDAALNEQSRNSCRHSNDDDDTMTMNPDTRQPPSNLRAGDRRCVVANYHRPASVARCCVRNISKIFAE